MKLDCYSVFRADIQKLRPRVHMQLLELKEFLFIVRNEILYAIFSLWFKSQFNEEHNTVRRQRNIFCCNCFCLFTFDMKACDFFIFHEISFPSYDVGHQNQILEPNVAKNALLLSSPL